MTCLRWVKPTNIDFKFAHTGNPFRYSSTIWKNLQFKTKLVVLAQFVWKWRRKESAWVSIFQWKLQFFSLFYMFFGQNFKTDYQSSLWWEPSSIKLQVICFKVKETSTQSAVPVLHSKGLAYITCNWWQGMNDVGNFAITLIHHFQKWGRTKTKSKWGKLKNWLVD